MHRTIVSTASYIYGQENVYKTPSDRSFYHEKAQPVWLSIYTNFLNYIRSYLGKERKEKKNKEEEKMLPVAGTGLSHP